MRHATTVILSCFLLTAADAKLSAQNGNSAHAQPHQGPAPKSTGGNPHTTTTTPGKPTTTTATNGKPTTTTTTTTKTHGKPTTTTAAAATTTTSGTTGTTTGTSTTGTTGTTTDVTATVPTTTFVKNTKLEQRLKPLLPAGTNMNTAANGFKNWGQFVAAVHVSNNLGIPFRQLKAKMTGATAMSLGQAIQSVRSTSTTPTSTTGGTTTTPTTTTTTVQAAVSKAESEAAEDLRQAKSDRHR